MANPIAVPGTNVPSGAAVSPGGAQGPSAVSANANNKATLGSDSLVLVQGTAAGVAATTHAQTVSGDDPQLTNTRTPTAHASTHNLGGSDATAPDWTQVANKPTTFAPTDYYAADATNTNTYAVTVAADFGLRTGVTVFVTITNGNTAANPTLNVNSTGAKTIVTRANTALAANELPPGTFGVTYDGTAWRLITPVHRSFTSTNVLNPVIECAGFDSIVAICAVTTVTGQAILLSHLASGIPVTVVVNNAQGSTNLYSITATTPAGAAFANVFWNWSNSNTTGAAFISLTTAMSQSANSGLTFQGQAAGSTLYLK